MKKLLTIVLALAMVLCMGVFSFAAAEAVSGTLADGTVISKPVSEVLKNGEAALMELQDAAPEKAASLEAFLAASEAGSRTISCGVVDFGGFFDEISEDTVIVPLPAPGTRKGDKVLVSLSNDMSRVLTSDEDGIVNVAFPRSTSCVGYCVSVMKAVDYWEPPPAPPPSGGESAGDSWPKREILNDSDNGQFYGYYFVDTYADGTQVWGDGVYNKEDPSLYNYEWGTKFDSEGNPLGGTYTLNRRNVEDADIGFKGEIHESIVFDGNGKPVGGVSTASGTDTSGMGYTSEARKEYHSDGSYTVTNIMKDPDGNTVIDTATEFNADGTVKSTGSPVAYDPFSYEAV